MAPISHTKTLVAGLLLAASTTGLADLPRVMTIGVPSRRDMVLRLTEAPTSTGFSMLQDEPDAGRLYRHPIVTGSLLPFDRDWSALTAAQRASLRTRFQDLPAGDEPPFPVGGMSSVYKPISDTVNYLANFNLDGVQGLDATTTGLGLVVEPDGRVAQVNVYAEQTPQVTEAIAANLLAVRFKPGLCQGQPCRMEFPVSFTFDRISG